MAKKTAKEIIDESLPDLEVVEATESPMEDASRLATAPGPSLDQLREKFMGNAPTIANRGDSSSTSRLEELQQRFRGGSQQMTASDNVPAAAPSDVEVVQVRSKKTPADPVDDPGQRTVIISKSQGIIGSQG
jgi:hypothetical protein